MQNLVPQEPWELDILEMSTADLAKYELVDIREQPDDLNILKALLRRDVVRIPVSELSVNNPPLDKTKQYLLICQKGMTSAKLVAFLRGRGFDNVYSLSGGVEAVRRKFIA